MDENEASIAYRKLKVRWDALKQFITSKRGMWMKRAEKWPSSVKHENTAKHLADALDKLLELMKE